MKNESVVRLELSDYAYDICCDIEDMTRLWKDSGLSWNTDILSKFYVMSLLAKDIKEYLYEENDKDNKAENEAHKKRIDRIIEAFVQGVEACDGIADVDLYLKAHKDVTPEEIDEALVILDNSPEYSVYRPVVTVMNEDSKSISLPYTLVTRAGISYSDVVDYILRKEKAN